MLVLERAHGFRVLLHAAHAVLPASDLILRHAEREQRDQVVDEAPAFMTEKRHVALLEAHDAALAQVDRRPRQRVLLPGVRNRGKPLALLRLA